jgi:hypothetical protein
VQETENIVFDGAEAAVARVNLDGAPTEATLARSATARGRARPAARDAALNGATIASVGIL